MSQRVHRALVVCAALFGCDTTANSEPAADTAVTAPAPAPSPPSLPPPAEAENTDKVEKNAPAPAPAEPAPPPPPSGKVTAELKQALGRSINRLTIDLQRKLAKQPGNLVVSGMSVAVALSQLHAGSRGATAKELANVLRLDGIGGDPRAGLAALAARWNHPEKHITLATASRLFGEQKLALQPGFADFTALDFAGDAAGARDKINGWMNDNTGDQIAEVFPPGALDPRTRLLVADAAHFAGDWMEPFDAAATTPQMFYGVEHKRMVPMMRSVQRLPVTLGLSGKVRVLELPYKGGAYSMVIVMPVKRGGLAAIEKSFDADKLQSWLDAAKPAPIELTLPRFTLDSSLDLEAVVQKLGAAKVFDPKRADLSGITSEKKLALSRVRHRARVVVAEHSSDTPPTANAIEISVGGAPASPTPFLVDRPFLFYIRDVRSGVLLFYGRVLDPE